MTSLNLPDQLSPLLYLGKVSDFQKCPKMYYWAHHLHLQPIGKSASMAFGSFCHKMFLEVALVYGPQAAEALLCDRVDLCQAVGYKPTKEILTLLNEASLEDKKLAANMLDAFMGGWNAKPRKLMGIEKTVKFDISHLSSFFTHWCVKADMMFEDDEGLWVGDLKTTASYGASIAKYYHSSPQTKTYFWILQQLMPNFRGTKIFVVTKQKIRCEVETILLTDADKYQAEMFVGESIKAIDEAEAWSKAQAVNHPPFSRSMTSCINWMGQECPYIPLCINRIKDEAYLNDLVTNWYKVESPDKHLELD